jgi:hypothetical protein
MKLVLKWSEANELTSACRTFMKVESNIKDSYIHPRTGDTIYTVLDRKTRLYLEFTLQENQLTGERYVNWARVNGSDKHVNEFLVAAGSIFAATETAKDFVEPEF